MIPGLHPLARLYERAFLRWALRHLSPTHAVVPAIVRYLGDADRAPSPLDPADTITVGACFVAFLALLAMAWAGWMAMPANN